MVSAQWLYFLGSMCCAVCHFHDVPPFFVLLLLIMLSSKGMAGIDLATLIESDLRHGGSLS